MDCITSFLKDSMSVYYIIGLGILILLCMYDIFTSSALSSYLSSYKYEEPNGPSTWCVNFPDAGGKRQSPINIVTSNVITIPLETTVPLEFSNLYCSIPAEMKLYNSGHSVIVYTNWINNYRPLIKGGPLKEPYKYLNMRFHWGPTLEEGSEHMIDTERYAMELQVMYVKVTCNFDDIIEAAKCGALLIVSYLFLATPIDNPFMDSIVSALPCIRLPLTCTLIEPLPIAVLSPPFSRKYFTYIGSLTYPPCTQGVRWIIQPEPLSISPRQVRKFRKLLGCNGVLHMNTRPVQCPNNRDIFYYD